MIGRACLFALLALTACTDDAAPGGPTIDEAVPTPVAPGGRLALVGRAFGATGHVAIGGRAAVVEAWAADRIEVVVAPDQAPGDTVVVVVAEGRPSAPFPLAIAGRPVRPTDAGRDFPPRADGGPPPPDAEAPDAARPDRGVEGPLVGEFISDPAGMGDIRLQAVAAEPGELVLEVVLPRDAAARWGLAFHLAWDRGLMTLIAADPSGSPRAHAAEIGPGRLAAGRLLDGRPTAFRLRFRLTGRGEGRITFPLRDRALRDRDNRPVPTGFAEGTIRVQAAP